MKTPEEILQVEKEIVLRRDWNTVVFYDLNLNTVTLK